MFVTEKQARAMLRKRALPKSLLNFLRWSRLPRGWAAGRSRLDQASCRQGSNAVFGQTPAHRGGPAMNTRPDATAWLTLVVLDGDCNAMILAHATSGRDRDWPVAVGHISERAGRPVEVVPAALKPPLTPGRSALSSCASAGFAVKRR